MIRQNEKERKVDTKSPFLVETPNHSERKEGEHAKPVYGAFATKPKPKKGGELIGTDCFA